MGNFYGLETAVLENQHLRLEYLLAAGPRIVRLVPSQTGRNLLAELPDAVIPAPHGDFALRGGHRLWHAPEVAARTYVPDSDPVRVETLPEGVRLTQPTERPTGITKQITITLDPELPRVTVEHSLRNDGPWRVELAPWAITQVRLGGTAVLPQQVAPLDPDGLLPNRRLAFWPYTRVRDPRLVAGDAFVVIQGVVQPDAFKIGYFNPHGWMAYLLDGLFLFKHFDPQPGLPHPDAGCNCEIYANNSFLELETLGPLQQLDPGTAVVHREVWEVQAIDHVPISTDEIAARAAALA